VRHDKSSILVDYLDPLADLVFLGDDLVSSNSISEVRYLNAVAEKDLSEYKGRDLDSNGAGVLLSVGSNFNNKGIDFSSLRHGIEREESQTVLVKAILVFASISHVVLPSGKLNPSLFVFLGHFQYLGVDLISRSELVELLNSGALYSVEATDEGDSTNLSNVDIEAVAFDTFKRARDHKAFFERGIVFLVFDGIRIDSLRKS
jgi:hypothetical protein